MEQADPSLCRHEVGQKLQSPHIVTNRHGIRERGRVSAEFCPDAADGIPTTKSEAGNFGFCNGIRLETEQKTGIMASRLVVLLVSFEDGLDASQIAEICEKMSEAHLGAWHMVGEPNWGVKRNHGTMDATDRIMFKNVLTMY